MREKIKLESSAGTGHFYTTTKNKKTTTGKLEFYEKLKAEVPDGVAAMLQVPGVGPKRVVSIA